MTECASRQRRERAAKNAVASSALEGIVPSQAIKNDLLRYVNGDLSLDQMLKAAQRRYEQK